jgi:hypothetical protein
MNTKINGAGVSLADLVIHARNTAQKAFVDQTQLAAQLTKLDQFKSSGFDALDFSTWENAFNAELDMLAAFSKQASPATKAVAPAPASTAATS